MTIFLMEMRAFTLLLVTVGLCGQPTAEEKGREIFRACSGCHNVRTDARKAGPSLRTLFGKVRLINGKRAIEQNVEELITEGYNGMPSYKNMLRPQEWQELMAYLKTLRGRPEIDAVLKPIRGSDQDVLTKGAQLFEDECGSCHARNTSGAADPLTLYRRGAFIDGERAGERASEAAIVRLIREGHGGMQPKTETLDDAALFALIAHLKAQ